MLIDTHCHLEKAVARGEVDAVLDRMQSAGVGRCITVGTSARDWEPYLRLSTRDCVDWTVGIHPCDIDEEWRDQLSTIATYFATGPRPVAIGEIGLDFFHLPKYPDEAAEKRQLQEHVFLEQLSLAYQLDCPVVVHSRDAVRECIRLIDMSGIPWEHVVFHCFTEGPELVDEINQRGGRASFTGILTYKTAEAIRQAAVKQGLGRLMLETDSPYLAPEPVRGTPNEPANISHLARFAAELFGIELSELADITTNNAMEFFALSAK